LAELRYALPGGHDTFWGGPAIDLDIRFGNVNEDDRHPSHGCAERDGETDLDAVSKDVDGLYRMGRFDAWRSLDQPRIST
jgi:hypothetical protein